eukprot:XP_020404447.1 protein MAIN-LIKE 1-like [Zea mays]
MAQFHLLDPHYDEHHRGRLTAEGEVLPVLRVRTHDRFLEEMRYDERYTPLLQRAGLDVLSYQVRRGLPTFNPAALTALVDRWRPETHTFHLPCDATDDIASWMFLPCLTDWDTTGGYSWASAVLAFLYRQL